jgi:hypothetical protein
MLFELIWTNSTSYSRPSLSLHTKNDLHVRQILNKLTAECTYLKITNKFGLLNHSQNRTKWLTATNNLFICINEYILGLHIWWKSCCTYLFLQSTALYVWTLDSRIIHSKDKMPITLLLFTKNIIISTQHSNLYTQTKGWNAYLPAFMFQSTQIKINVYTMFLTIKNEWRLK